MYKKILVANRGEIACRMARTFRRLGAGVATVHSSADAQALHVREIGESVLIGEGPARQSYLDIEAVVRAAQRVGADAIHPGFGFLSENPELARRCAAAGLAFIGPAPETLELFGDKARAKALAQQLGIPTAGGLLEASDDPQTVLRAIEALPPPCIVKAVAGGGGKGMRVLRSREHAAEAVAAAIREGRSSFGDGRVIVERYLSRPRHVEVQILGDGRGGVIHLGDRECSLQRRHQKVVEEAPAASVPLALRERLWAHAVALGEATQYLGLGTVEFAVTDEGAVFLEVNPRLQVEHPVTECVTGLDLVELQVRTVCERRLPLRQPEVPALRGHAVQARLYAEDPEQGFLPSTGTIHVFEAGPGVRVDAGVVAGNEISPHYDPMIAKLIAHGTTRQEALDALRHALQATTLLGVTSNRGFLLELLAEPLVQANAVHTETIDEWLAARGTPAPESRHVAAALALWRLANQPPAPAGAWGDPDLAGWRMHRGHADIPVTLRYQVSTPTASWRIGFGAPAEGGAWQVRVDDQVHRVSVQPLADGHAHRVDVDGSTWIVAAVSLPRRLWAQLGATQLALDVAPLHASGSAGGPSRAGAIVAPMMGLVIAVHAEPGQAVVAGQTLATLESMKMEMSIAAPAAGVVDWVGCASGTKVERNQEVFRLAPAA
ncbi:biotin carboxylase N-terminal domain-containing protein [Ramlibacter tataouinensis]|uniref:ATP-binding protein n=1 Tax=Ramlibacter tataouinensis TaxID=94132 RepID=UPI0022F3A5EA|nr:biotin carboxylase N-terminal domain-containing protein [Ramlibacter tataouinensis]WBY03579.1 biotin carboxylase N-terminal domain-containing protein [Ramlibacter tataouinensis]